MKKALSCLLLFISTFNGVLAGAATQYNIVERAYSERGANTAVSAMSAGVTNTRAAKDYTVSSRIYEFIFGKKNDTQKTKYFYPGGSVFGLVLKEDGVTVTEVHDTRVIKTGDKIIGINGVSVATAKEVEQDVRSSNGKALTINVLRDGKEYELSVVPKEKDGKYTIGVTLRDQTAGIGTVTYIEPQTLNFAGLGHGVNDNRGNYVSVRSGVATTVTLGACKKGGVGYAGELTGILRHDTIGCINDNTECGVFGRLDALPDYCEEALPIGTKDEIHDGKAQIISTIKNGFRASYDIEIFDIDKTSDGSKSFKIKVTDPALLTISGGIVRGMSGSPIIQDGKLVGAVTHVLVANPSEGYGIFIENMLNAQQGKEQLKAA